MIFYYTNAQFVMSANLGLSHFLLGLLMTFLYIYVLSAIGYFIGTLVQVNKIFAFIIPALVLAVFALMKNQMVTLVKFYFAETHFLLFALNLLLTGACIFAITIAISNRTEVRK